MTQRRLLQLFMIAAIIVAVWALVGVYNASEFYRSALAMGGGGRVDWESTLRFHMIMSLNWAVWTPLIIFIADRLRQRNLAVLLIPVIPVLAFGRAAWGGAVLQVLEGSMPTFAFIWKSVGIRLHTYIAMTCFIVAATWFIERYRDSRARVQSALALQAAVANAEAEHLRSELQPALVFGTLAAIRGRVRTDPVTADRMIVRLAELLRRGLDRGVSADASVEEELDHTDRYVELQRFRFGTDIATRSIIDDDVLGARVPPLTLQTLIDTAISSSPPRLIELRGKTHGNALRLEARVRPSRIASLEDRGARLRDWFGPDCLTRLHMVDDTVIAAVELPLEYVA